MSDVHVNRGETATLDRVDGYLIVANHGSIQAANGKPIIVTKGVAFKGSGAIIGDLECSTLLCHGTLEVNGNLTVHTKLDIGHSIEAKGTIKAQDVDIGGKIEATSLICNRMRVGGTAEIDEIFEAQSVDVGGRVEADGTVRIGDLYVGGEAEVGGGAITGNIRIGGKFSANRPIEFGDLQVGCKGELPDNCKGHRISTLGKLTVEGTLECDIIEAGGYIEIDGNCQADKVEVGGKFSVGGALTVTDKLEGFGATEIKDNFAVQKLRISGRLIASRIEVKEDADISGRIETAQGLKAKTLIVRVGSRCDGPLIGERVEIGKSADLSWHGWSANWAQGWSMTGGMAKVDDIYGVEVILGPMCRADRIFADKVRMEQSSAAKQVTYISELSTTFGTAIAQPPIKVTELPKPPF